MRKPGLMAGLTLSVVGGAAAAHPAETLLQTASPAADPITRLTWWLLWVSIIVSILVTLGVAWGVMARGRRYDMALAEVALEPHGSGTRWIWLGIGVTSALLLASIVWTIVVLNATAAPAPGAPPLTLEVTGRQWWWQVRYVGDDPGQSFTVANEIHIPVGRPVRIRLLSHDVIHSFWVPALAGKTDMIPGRANLMWLQADKPGRYRGECQEYCGVQHAYMAFEVVAEPPDRFEAWRRAQLAAAAAPTDPAAEAGARIFEAKCGRCHAVRGTPAHGDDGPDLTHLMSRATLASGAVPNTPGALAGWIANPQGVKPGARMPATWLSGPQLTAVEAYLRGLQ